MAPVHARRLDLPWCLQWCEAVIHMNTLLAVNAQQHNSATSLNNLSRHAVCAFKKHLTALRQKSWHWQWHSAPRALPQLQLGHHEVALVHQHGWFSNHAPAAQGSACGIRAGHRSLAGYP